MAAAAETGGIGQAPVRRVNRRAMRGLKDKVAIVAGGATLIGATVARDLAARGVHVLIADIDAGLGRRAADAAGARFHRVDLREDRDIDACVAAAVSAFGGIDFLVNVAAVYIDGGAKARRQDWLAAFDVNVVGGAMMLNAVRPVMAARGGGAVVNFSSISGRVAQKGRWVYPACKAAVHQLTRSQALDLAPDRIRVNSVSPGWTWSSSFEDRSGGDRTTVDRIAGPFHILNRVGDPQEVAQAVAFLLSDEAAFITGTDIAADGGYSAIGPERDEQAGPRIAAEASKAK